MSKSDIGVIIMIIIALIIFIILSIYSIKCLSREAQKTLVGICNTISSIGCTICLIWLLCFFLGCLISKSLSLIVSLKNNSKVNLYF